MVASGAAASARLPKFLATSGSRQEASVEDALTDQQRNKDIAMACKRLITALGEDAAVGYLLGFEEIGDVTSRRLPHEVLGCVYLLKATLSHDSDAVR